MPKFGVDQETLSKLMLLEAQKMYRPLAGTISLSNSQFDGDVMDTQIAYALGKQSKLTYNLSPQVAENDKKLIYTADTRNVQFANKMLATAIGILGKDRYEPQVSRIDQVARDWRKQYRKKLKYAIIAKNAGLNIDHLTQELQLSDEEVPDKPDFIDAIIHGNAPLEHEANMVKALMQTHEEYDFDSMMDENIFYLLCNNVGGIRVNTNVPKMMIRKINPRFCSTSFSTKDNCDDITSFAEIIAVSLVWIKSNWMGNLDSETWEAIEARARSYDALQKAGFTGVMRRGSGGTDVIENEKFVLMMDFTFTRTYRSDFRFHNDTFTFDVQKGGESIYGKEMIEYSYSGFYLPGVSGGDKVFNCVQEFPQCRQTIPLSPKDRKISNPFKARIGVIMHRPMQTEGVAVSWIDRIMPHVDTLQRLKDQYDNVVANLKPGLLAIDINMLSDLLTSDKVRSIQDVRRIMMRLHKHGEIYYDSADLDNLKGGANRKPFEISIDPSVTMLSLIMDQIKEQILLIREFCGLPPLTDGIVEERQGAKVTEGAMGAVVSGLRIYSKALKSIYERTMKHLTILYQYTGVYGAYGHEDYEVDEAEFRHFILNTTCKLRPTEEEKARLYASADAAFAQGNGWLSYADLLYITRNPVLQDAENRFLYLDSINRKRIAAAQAAAEAKQDEINKNQAKMALDAELAKIDAKNQAKLSEIAADIAASSKKDMDLLRTELIANQPLQNAEIKQTFANVEKLMAEVHAILHPPKETTTDK